MTPPCVRLVKLSDDARSGGLVLKQFRPLVAAVSAVVFVGGAMSLALMTTEPELRAIPQQTPSVAHSWEPRDPDARTSRGLGDGSILRLGALPMTEAGDPLPLAPDPQAPGEDTTVLTSPSAIATESIGTIDADTGRLLSQPVRGPITSRFGMRLHPVLGYHKLHSGLDFGAPCGAPVGAAAPGRVTRTGWAGGNGVQVRIDHGRIAGHHVVTTYNHLSSIAVTVGQEVTTHQGVGRVGSTGYSTGCHLHFEVIVDGQFQNPEAWLNGTPAVDASFAAAPSSVPIPGSPSQPAGTTTAPSGTPTTAPAPGTPTTSSAPSSTAPAPTRTTPSAPVTTSTPPSSPAESSTVPSPSPSTPSPSRSTTAPTESEPSAPTGSGSEPASPSSAAEAESSS